MILNAAATTADKQVASASETGCRRARIPEIDGFRALAMLVVYCFHVWQFSGSPTASLHLLGLHLDPYWPSWPRLPVYTSWASPSTFPLPCPYEINLPPSPLPGRSSWRACMKAHSAA